MGNWIIRWNYDKPAYEPGKQALISFWIENLGDTYIYLSDLSLNFDFGVYNLAVIAGMVEPREYKYLGNIRLALPNKAVGQRTFAVSYRIYEYVNGSWIDLGIKQSRQYRIGIYPHPFFKVFVSRGLRPEDRAIGDPIVQMIREWGFNTVTIGIERQVPEEQVSTAVKEEIKQSDAIIAIATPRFLDALTGLWKTLDWLHGEVGIAYGKDKPLLILKDKRVSLGGLPSYLAELDRLPLIEFDSYNLNEVPSLLAAIMPGFRDWITSKRRQEFFAVLRDLLVEGLAVVGGIAIISGIVGSIRGSSRG